MSRIVTFLAAAIVVTGPLACDSEDLTTPPECSVDTECDDKAPCTLDRCDPVAKVCLHPPKSCDDSDFCTQDSCISETGECLNVAKVCDDLNLCTNDSCDPAIGCVFAPITCVGDGDPCTIAECLPETGVCQEHQKACNDNNVCTTDACGANGECTFTPAADGSACSGGPDFTDASICQAGTCVPAAQMQQGAFRANSLSLAKPTVTFDLGNGPEVMNEAISTFLTSKLNEFEGGGLVAILETLMFGGPGTPMSVGEGQCAFQESDVRWCGLLEGGQNVTFPLVQLISTGTCMDQPAVAAPCFLSIETEFDLHEILPNFFPNPVPPVKGRVFGGLPGNPISGIENGWAAAFVPKEIVDGLSVSLGDRIVTGAELLKDVPVETIDATAGYTVHVSFTAPRTAVQPR